MAGDEYDGSGTTEPWPGAKPGRLTRRRLVTAAVGVSTAAVAVLGRHTDRPITVGARRQDGTGVEEVLPTGSPAASPLAGTPGATPAASPEAAGLQIVRAPFLDDPGPPVRDGTLRLTIGTTLGNFNPVAGAQDPQVAASYLDGLLRTDPVTMEPVPSLATEWSWSEDRTEITLTLRDDISWHDGSALTPEDARFSYLVYRDDAGSAYARFFDLLREIEIVDDRRLRVRFSEPDGGWLANAATLPIFQGAQYQAFWSDQPSGARTLNGFDWATSLPVGTGPWRVREWRERRIEFEAHDEYWDGAPYADRLELTTFEDPAARVERWRSGEADLVWPVPPNLVESLARDPGRLYVCDAASVLFAAFNFANPVRDVPGLPGLLSDIRLRSALSVAIDRQRYADEVFGGFIRHEFAGTIAQPWANDSTLTNPPYNRIAAEVLLTGSGYVDRDGDGIREDGNGTPLALVAIVELNGSPGLEAILRSVAEDLAAVGVGLEVQALDPVAFNERWQVTHDFDLIAYGFRLFPGFTDFDLYGSTWDIRTNLQGWNPGGYRNGAVDDVIADVLTTTAIDEQVGLLHELQRLVDEDLFGLWFGFPQDLVLVGPSVRGFRPVVEWQTRDTRLMWLQE